MPRKTIPLPKGFTLRNGYLQRYLPKHPMAMADGYIPEHRLVMSLHIGRDLRPDEDVHHLDGNRRNNDISNLELCPHSVHAKNHHDAREVSCPFCGNPTKSRRGICKKCYDRWRYRHTKDRPSHLKEICPFCQKDY